MINKLSLFGIVIICLVLFLYIADLPKLYFLNDDNIFIPASKGFNFLYGTSFRPVSDLTLQADYLLWNTNAAGYHFTNFFMHLVTTILFFFFTGKMLDRYGLNEVSSYKPLAAAVLFFFYPFHSEAVFWIIGRGALLGALFGLASVLLYLYRQKSRWYLVTSIAFFFVGAFAYETIWIVPLIVLFITYFDIKLFPLQKRLLIKDAIIFCSFFVLYIIIRTSIIGEIGGSPYGSAAIMKFNAFSLLKNYNIMIGRTFLPPMQSAVLFIVFYIILLVLGFFFFRKMILTKRISKSLVITASVFLLSFVPVITLGVDLHDSESERFLYFPSVFAAVLLAEAIFELGKTPQMRIFFFSLLFCAAVFYFAAAASVYQVSSNVAKVSMTAVSGLKNNSNIYCINLPSQYKGGLIYRNGFKEAVSWLASPDSISVIRISEAELFHTPLFYQIKYVSLSKLSQQDANDIFKILPANLVFDEHDVAFKWTDSSLLVVKLNGVF